MKRNFILLLFVSSLFFGIFVSAQLDGLENQIEGISENLENNVTKLKEFTEKSKWDFIGSQWKEFLLKNKAIAGVDAFFTKINVVFLVLFARDWSISMGMLFAFLLWLFTLFSLYWYASAYDLKSWKIFLLSICGTIALAHIRLFNVLSVIFEKMMFYKATFLWKMSIFILVIVLINVYLFINKFFSKQIKISREKAKQQSLEDEVNKSKVFRVNLQNASNEI